MALRIATFNLKDFFLPRNATEQAVGVQKIANVAASLRRANADVVALQEVGGAEILDRLVAEVKDLSYGPPVLGTEDKRGIRNAILSRLPVQWSQVHTAKSLPFPPLVEGDPDPYAGRIPLRRGIVHVRVDAGALGEVDVLTAHFKSNLPALLKGAAGKEVPDTNVHMAGQSAIRSLVQRAAEALFVRGLVDEVFAKSPDHAICVLGDLNDTPTSLPVRLVRGLDATHRHHLRAAGEDMPAERRFSSFHGGAPILIDHILCSDRLHRALTSFEIHNEALRYHGPYVEGEVELTVDSDHALNVAEFAG
ncbi:MAG: endonuclease/exonuclease/phosphatase family protein [Labilithrix sp.]|nr:endonuclease/exonuclease/phosphatase family protein [Labilithrix sp.]MCW5812039.1 endonuclease/exonuclease/phosphatase family protein [Labilithrix sp.]